MKSLGLASRATGHVLDAIGTQSGGLELPANDPREIDVRLANTTRDRVTPADRQGSPLRLARPFGVWGGYQKRQKTRE